MTRIMFTRTFWLDTAERTIKAFAGGCSGALAANIVGASVAWPAVLFAGFIAGVTMLLVSVASAPVPGISPASALPPGV